MNKRDAWGYTALHKLAQAGKITTIDTILSSLADSHFGMKDSNILASRINVNCQCELKTFSPQGKKDGSDRKGLDKISLLHFLRRSNCDSVAVYDLITKHMKQYAFDLDTILNGISFKVWCNETRIGCFAG